MTVEEASPEIEVWPDNAQSLNVFIAMSTQWRRAGQSGIAVGLDYSVLPEIWRLTKTPRDQRSEIFENLRVMEDAALTQMGKNAAKRKR